MSELARPTWALMALFMAGIGCESSPTFSSSRTLKGQYELTTEVTCLISSDVRVEIDGTRTGNTLRYEFPATLTASTATRARTLLEKLAIEFDKPEPSRLDLVLETPKNARLSGTLKLSLPSTLDVRIQTPASIRVAGMGRSIGIIATGGIEVVGAEGDLAVQGRSAIALDWRANQNTQLAASVENGNIFLTLPPSLSIDVLAEARGGGAVSVQHAALPAPIGTGRTRYRATINGGLATAQLLTQAGAIFIGTR